MPIIILHDLTNVQGRNKEHSRRTQTDALGSSSTAAWGLRDVAPGGDRNREETDADIQMPATTVYISAIVTS